MTMSEAERHNAELNYFRVIPNPILNSSFKQSIFEEKLRRIMQEAVGSASKFFEQIFTKKTKLKDEFKMGFGITLLGQDFQNLPALLINQFFKIYE